MRGDGGFWYGNVGVNEALGEVSMRRESECDRNE